jgi:hypothetical protein
MKKSFSDDKLERVRTEKHVKFATGDSDVSDEEPTDRAPLISKSMIKKLNSHIFSKFQPKKVRSNFF